MRRAARGRGLLALVSAVLLSCAGGAHAFTLLNGREAFCEVEWLGVPHVVAEEYVGNGKVGERHPELGGSAAVVRRQADGSPKIVFDTSILESIRLKLPVARDFVFFHECAHIQRQTQDEIVANCHALAEAARAGVLEDGMLPALGAFHRNMGRLPRKYGGSGARFWDRTLECVADPESVAEDLQAFPGTLFDPPYAP
jgi:hypothetical protein